MKLLEPTSGKILLSNTNYKDIDSKKIREKIGYVSQDTILFKGTIRENIALWDPNLMNQTDEIISCMKLSSCEELVCRLDENIGEQGLKLSGGQKQRLIIAREILKSPNILILDEPTSALDKRNQFKIKQQLTS